MEPFNLFDLNAMFEFAASETAAYWISLGITFLLSTLITGILLMIVMGIASRETGVPVRVGNIFLVVALINLINFLGIMGLMISFIAGVPFIVFILPALIWIGFLKLFFSDMRWLHILIIGIIFYAITLFIVPYITTFISSFIPL